VSTGVQCKIDPRYRVPAPGETRICAAHRQQIRLAAMQRSPSVSVRFIGKVLALLADHEPEAG
jgi:hypothetical protein